jgi:hypothetical protein
MLIIGNLQIWHFPRVLLFVRGGTGVEYGIIKNITEK